MSTEIERCQRWRRRFREKLTSIEGSDGTDPSKTAQRKCDGSEFGDLVSSEKNGKCITFRLEKVDTTSGLVLTTMIRLVQSLRLILVDLPLVTYLPTIV